MKKLFLASLLALLSLCVNAYDFEADGIYYNITGDNTVEVTKSENGKYESDIVIPNNVIYNSKEYSVTSIGESAFYWCSNLTSIKIPESVTNIGNYAFSGCGELTSINIPESVTSIGEGAFSGCGLTSIRISESVKSIGERAFGACSNLTSIIVASGNTVYDSRNDCNAIIRTSDNCLIQGCDNTAIPINVTSIGVYAFGGCSNLTLINIPEGVTSIEEGGFQGCLSLTSINIPKGVTSIESYAFSGCSSLTSISIPKGVTSIGKEAFWGCI